MVVTDAPARGMRRLLVRLAGAAPVRIFALEGADVPAPLGDLRLHDDVRLLDSPRSANVLLVAGRLPTALHDAARRVHGMLSHPRATLVWTASSAGAGDDDLFPHATVVGPSDDLVKTLRRVQRELLTRQRSSDAALLPDDEPAPWRGVGPYGQGGTGMTGGVPYGRPMAERAADRDGLELDQLPVRVGPFFPAFPTGLTLDVRLQGDIVQDVSVGDNPFATSAGSAEDHAADVTSTDPFRRALTEPVLIAELELARARHHLRWLAHALRTHGLGMLGRRVLAMLPVLEPGRIDDVRALRRLLQRTRGLGWSTAGVGSIPGDRIAGQGLGPVARAAGLREDARLEDAAYGALDFEPIVQTEGDAGARWRQRLMEAAQSLELAGRAGDRRTESAQAVESPRGLWGPGHDPVTVLLALVPELLRNLEWGDAVTTVVSLDLDLREAAVSGANEKANRRSREDAA